MASKDMVSKGIQLKATPSRAINSQDTRQATSRGILNKATNNKVRPDIFLASVRNLVMTARIWSLCIPINLGTIHAIDHLHAAFVHANLNSALEHSLSKCSIAGQTLASCAVHLCSPAGRHICASA